MILVGVRNPLPKRAVDRADFVGPKKPRTPKQLAAQAAKLGELATPHGSVRLKLFSLDRRGRLGWRFSAPIRLHGKPKRLLGDGSMSLSPSLIQVGAKVRLSCPVEVRPPVTITDKAFAAGSIKFNGQHAVKGRVMSVDVGINTAATAAIVDSTGTVIARAFFTCGRHNDRRDALGAVIASKQVLSGGTRKGEAFCSELHRRIAGLSLDAARVLTSDLIAFAQRHGATVLVIEDLKGWRPKGPSHAQRKRFHRFQHRMLVRCLTLKAEELGLRLLEVAARGTSRWAYDGSGKVTRDPKNAQLATFSKTIRHPKGKRYNADLNGALNIAARGLAIVLGIEHIVQLAPDLASKEKAVSGKSSGAAVRIPLVLADIWAYAKRVGPLLPGTYNRQQGVSV